MRDANTRIFVASFTPREILLDNELVPKQACTTFNTSVINTSLLHSWISSLPSTWNRNPGWRLGVGRRETLGPDKPQKGRNSLGRYVVLTGVSASHQGQAVSGLWWWPGWECPLVSMCGLQTSSRLYRLGMKADSSYESEFEWQSSFPHLAHESGTRVGQSKVEALLNCYVWSSFWLRQWLGI